MTVPQSIVPVFIFWAFIGGLGASPLLPGGLMLAVLSVSSTSLTNASTVFPEHRKARVSQTIESSSHH
jgi:hypothetical protein